jgi:hypothetical protein
LWTPKVGRVDSQACAGWNLWGAAGERWGSTGGGRRWGSAAKGGRAPREGAGRRHGDGAGAPPGKEGGRRRGEGGRRQAARRGIGEGGCRRRRRCRRGGVWVADRSRTVEDGWGLATGKKVGRRRSFPRGSSLDSVTGSLALATAARRRRPGRRWSQIGEHWLETTEGNGKLMGG